MQRRQNSGDVLTCVLWVRARACVCLWFCVCVCAVAVPVVGHVLQTQTIEVFFLDTAVKLSLQMLLNWMKTPALQAED